MAVTEALRVLKHRLSDLVVFAALQADLAHNLTLVT